MAVIPQRQYLAWQEEISEDWNTPDRHDYYVMALTNVVIGLFGKMEDSLDKFKILFSTLEQQQDPTIKSKAYIEQRKAEMMAEAQSGALSKAPRPEGLARN